MGWGYDGMETVHQILDHKKLGSGPQNLEGIPSGTSKQVSFPQEERNLNRSSKLKNLKYFGKSSVSPSVPKLWGTPWEAGVFGAGPGRLIPRAATLCHAHLCERGSEVGQAGLMSSSTSLRGKEAPALASCVRTPVICGHKVPQ